MKKDSNPPKVIIFYGASQSGKSFFAKEVQKQLNTQGYDVHFTPRYYTRAKRTGVSEDENSIFEQKINDKDFDIVVNIYGNEVGTKISEVQQMLKSGTMPIFLTSENKNVDKMLKFFPDAIAFKTLMKKPLTLDDYFQKEKERNPQLSDERNLDSAKRRFALYKEIEQDNSGVQNVILNPYGDDNIKDLQQQTNYLVDNICQKIKSETRKKSILEIGKRKVLKIVLTIKERITGWDTKRY